MGKSKVIAIVILMVLLTGVSFGWAKDSAEEKVLAQVGQYKLTLKQFNDQIRSLPPQLQMAVQRNPQLKKQLLDRWVELTLMALEARKENMQDNPEVKKRIEDMTNALLAQHYMKLNVSDKANVSDKEVRDYYNKHKSEFVQPEQVRARHILVKVPANADKKQWEEAKKKALEIRAKLLKGESFAELAQKYSDDPGSKARGGDLGYFSKGQMVPEFEKAAFSLKKGEISQPVKTTFGYHIIKVEDKKPSKQRSFNEVQQEIRQKLLREKQIKLREEIVANLKKKYPVKVHEELLNNSNSMPNDSFHKKPKK